MTIKLLAGVSVATLAWAFMFLGPKRTFWTRAALAGLTISVYAWAADPGAIRDQLVERHWAGDLAVGVASAVGLWLVFWLGEQLLVLILPTLASEVGELYSVKGEAQRALIPIVLAVTAPGEELFFRGFLYHRAGVVLGLAAYAAVHIPERKTILVIAALVGGALWGALFSWTGGLIAPITSHLLWIFMIVMWKPARPLVVVLRLKARLRPSPATP